MNVEEKLAFFLFLPSLNYIRMRLFEGAITFIIPNIKID